MLLHRCFPVRQEAKVAAEMAAEAKSMFLANSEPFGR